MKQLSTILVFLIILLSFHTSWGEKSLQQKSDELKNTIEAEIPNGDLYTRAIELFVKKVSYDDRKLNKLISRVNELENKLWNKEPRSIKEEQILQLVIYIKYQAFIYTTPIQEPKEAIIEEETIDDKESTINFLDISPEEFEDWNMILSESALKSHLKKIYKDYKGISSGSLAKKLSEDVQKVTDWYDTEGEITRDTQRISDLEEIKIQLEQYYQDNGKYPDYDTIRNDISDIPVDDLGAISKNNCRFGYIYEVWNQNQDYRLSSCIESPINTEIINSDGGIDNFRYEVGTDISYEGKGVAYIQNSDLYYFSLVDQNSEGGSIQRYSTWSQIPPISSPSEKDVLRILLSLEHQYQNSWRDKNIVLENTMNILASAIDNYFLTGNILDLIEHDSKYAGENIAIAGSLIGGENYKVGKIDYEKLGLSGDFPKDTLGKDFILAYANTGWGHYQIIGFKRDIVEEKKYKKTHILGTYYPINKTLTNGIDYSIVSTSQFQLLDTSLQYLFKRGEGINEEYNIISVDYETNTITVDKEIGDLPKIIFQQPKGLIFDPQTNSPYLKGMTFEIR